MRQESPVRVERQMGDQDGRERTSSQHTVDFKTAQTQFGARVLAFDRAMDAEREVSPGTMEQAVVAPATVRLQDVPMSQAEIHDGMLRRKAEAIHREISKMEPHRSRHTTVEQIYQQMSQSLG